jgi:hypothetical protein
LLFCYFLLIFGTVEGREVFRVPAHFRSLGDASVSLQSPLSVFSNPAGFADDKRLAFGVLYENRFLLSVEYSVGFPCPYCGQYQFGLFIFAIRAVASG